MQRNRKDERRGKRKKRKEHKPVNSSVGSVRRRKKKNGNLYMLKVMESTALFAIGLERKKEEAMEGGKKVTEKPPEEQV